MFEWILANIGSIIVGLLLAVIVSVIIASMIRNKKRGKSSCGCGCEGCAFSGSCHAASNGPKSKK